LIKLVLLLHKVYPEIQYETIPIQEKKIATENALRARVEDLLSELSDKRTQIDDLNDTLSAAQARTTQAEKQLEASEQKMEEMVSKEQVKEMEALFLDTVSKLSSRVQSLEVQKTSAGAGAGSNSNSSSGPTASRPAPVSSVTAVSGASGRGSYVDAASRPGGQHASYGSAVGLVLFAPSHPPPTLPASHPTSHPPPLSFLPRR
jgi:TolA-binding protein